MPYNRHQTGGNTRGGQPGAGKSNPFMAPVFAIVKDNIDPVRSGRIRVYVAGMSSLDANDEQAWITVQLLTPFTGHTEGDRDPDETFNDMGKSTPSKYLNNPTAYGFWYSPPDLESKVVVIFIEGDPTYGFWIGATPRGDVLHTAPAVGCIDPSKIIFYGAQASILGGARKLPVTNIHPSESDDPGFLDLKKPLHAYEAATLNQQGLIRDQTRGTIGSFAQRESPSRLGFGVLTPGRPIYAGGYRDADFPEILPGCSDPSLKVLTRRTGHSLVMDDGSIEGYDNLVRLRTSHGHQLIMNDTEQTIFLIHANGQSWIEMGLEGTIDAYSTNSINMRTHGDINFHADRNISFHALESFKLCAKNIITESEKTTKMKAGTDFMKHVKGNYTLKVDKLMSMASVGFASFSGLATTFVNGLTVRINSGISPLIPQKIKSITRVLHTDVKFDPSVGFIENPLHLVSITSRCPTHAGGTNGWPEAGFGVDVKVDLETDTTT